MLIFKRYIIAFVIIMLANCVGCGQTGDLYLPEDDPKQKSKDQSKN